MANNSDKDIGNAIISYIAKEFLIDLKQDQYVQLRIEDKLEEEMQRKEKQYIDQFFTSIQKNLKEQEKTSFDAASLQARATEYVDNILEEECKDVVQAKMELLEEETKFKKNQTSIETVNQVKSNIQTLQEFYKLSTAQELSKQADMYSKIIETYFKLVNNLEKKADFLVKYVQERPKDEVGARLEKQVMDFLKKTYDEIKMQNVLIKNATNNQSKLIDKYKQIAACLDAKSPLAATLFPFEFNNN